VEVLKRCTPGLLLLMGAACQPESTPLDLSVSRLVVHALLQAGADTVRVSVSRTKPNPREDEAHSDPVSNASVRLVHLADTFALLPGRPCILYELLPASLNAGCYSATLPQGVRAGAMYELLVDIPGETVVHGRSRVPTVPALLTPAPGSELPFSVPIGPGYPIDLRYLRNPFLVHWSAPEPHRWAEIRLPSDQPGCATALHSPATQYGELVEVTGVDTATMALSVSCGGAAPARQNGRLILTTYDSAYSRFAILNFQRKSVRLTDASIGVSGALGVFGAAATVSIPVVLVPR
jgi:uncharacterized protein DUF4249